MSGGLDARSGTVPVCGLQYITSPSLPSAVKAARDTMTKSSTTLPLIAGSIGSFAMSVTSAATAPSRMDSFPHSALQLYDSYYAVQQRNESAMPMTSGDGNQAACTGSLTLPDDLSGIGPSARRLLQLDAEQQQQQQQQQRITKSGAKKPARAPAVSPVTSHLLGAQRPKSKAVSTAPATAATLSTKALLHSPHPKFMGDTASGAHARTATLRNLEHTMDVRSPMLASSITHPPHCGGNATSTMPADAATPPLVKQLQSYIKRELILNSDGTGVPSVIDQLNPYREAFRALRSAFPAYAALFDDIQCAYDNAIQAQAELVSEAYSAVVARRVEKVTQLESVAALHQQVHSLQEELGKMEEALQSRVHAQETERLHSAMQRPRTGRTNDRLELHRELEVATQRVAELERKSQIDLEKILVLIGAMRECDRRLKEYERLVTSVMGQVSELDEFKRIAGDAQAELERFRKKYANYVPASDFCLMREHLTSELEAAHLMTRRWRRTAAVRGTQLDVMQSRLKVLEEERETLVKAAEAAAAPHYDAQAHGVSTDTVLTPRPSWGRIYELYPDLCAYAADAGQLTTELDGDDDDTEANVRENCTSAIDASTSANLAVGLPTVKGPKETGLQVEYLVQRILALEGILRAQGQQQRVLYSSSAGLVEGGDELADAAHTNSVKNLPEVSLAAKDKPPSSSPILQHRNSRHTRGHGEGLCNAFSSTIAGSPATRSVPPLELPLLGLGYGTQVHPCWRASGVLSRCPVAPPTILSMVYHFFLDVLPTYLEQEDKAQQASGQAVASAQGSADRLAPFLYEFLQSEMQVREDLSAYDSVAHLTMNLERDGDKREWYSDALHLFSWIVHGVMPPRIGVDAAVLVAQVKHDIHALSKELQSSRVRRQALGECLQPVLELKTVAELAELRAALGGETTFSAEALCSDTHPFMQVLLKQECRAGMELYVSLLHALTVRARFMTASDARAAAPASAAAGSKGTRDSKVPPAPLLAENDRVLSLEDVSAAVLEAEPCTPEVVLREVSLNAVSKGLQVPGAERARGETVGDTTTSKASASNEPLVVVRLSDMVQVIGAAPILRRSRRTSKTDCAL
ncbi:hypothetical protein LSCM1_03872 [Leishmania martiniquensis]|uniref:Translin-associated factor X-interacting protein 1 N-terminal domain-containing protein n=1 Tax=Leishmania martiniquensis TaxID=1580590 RepID=A0A836GZD7_9TRYP|nr:hypothetical protein LSCM1_03872 [Leishmania martiniquensis]